MPAVSKRAHLIAHALELFYRHGFHATGIDLIIATAKVSKKTLYNHFESKDALIAAVLEKRDNDFFDFLTSGAVANSEYPKMQLIGLFDVLDEWFNQDNFFGCMFINAAGEFSQFEHPCHQLCASHKQRIANWVLGLCERAKLISPDVLTKQLMLLMEGAIVDAHVNGNKNAAIDAKTVAKLLVNIHNQH